MDFLAVQHELEVHFLGLILAASLFTSGIIAYIINFLRYGLPTSEQIGNVYGDESVRATA